MNDFDVSVVELLERVSPPARRVPDWDNVLERASISIVSAPERSSRRRVYSAAVAVGVALVAAVVLALVVPWGHGPAAITRAQAALILHRAAAAIAPRPGWVFHEREKVFEFVPGTQFKRTGTIEYWIVNSPPYQFRYRTDLPDLSSPVETGGEAGRGRGFAYDPQTNTLYRQPADRFSPGFHDAAAGLREQIARGKAKVVGRSRIDGRSVYEIAFTGTSQPPAARPSPRIFVDTGSYIPVRINWMNVGYLNGYWYASATDILSYQYLPPTASNLALADIQRSHTGATIAPAAKMPAAFRNRVNPPLQPTSGR